MNKVLRNIALCAVVLMAVVSAGCKTTGTKEPAAAVTGSVAAPTDGTVSITVTPASASGYGENVGQSALQSTILDWSNRTMGQVSQPAWLKPLTINNNASVFQSEFGIDSSNRVNFSVGKNRDLDNARIDADLLYAQIIGTELKRYLMVATSRITDNPGVIERLNEITSVTKVYVANVRRAADFWQLVETVDNGQKAREYVYYIVYTIPQNTWTQIVRKYVNDVIGVIPDTPTKKLVAEAYGDIQAEADRVNQRSDAEFQQMLQLQAQAARDAQEQAMARINQQTVLGTAQARTAQTQVQAEADARYGAYRYGDAAAAAAASTTAADFDWISALSTAAQVIK